MALRDKITPKQVNELIGKLFDLHWNSGEGAYLHFKGDEVRDFLSENNIDLDEDEQESLNDLTSTSQVKKGVGAVTQADIDAYDPAPPPVHRTPAEIRADRLKEYTEAEIAEFGLRAFEIIINDENWGKYTFDMIWNDNDVTMYEGNDQDPVTEKIEQDIDDRIHVARHAHSYIRLAEIVKSLLMFGGVISESSDAGYLLEQIEKDEEE